MRLLLALATTALLTVGCSAPEACPDLTENPDGTHTIASPHPTADPAGCEYEYNDQGELTTERDTDG